ncbi:hypothetical protein Anas_00776, partial [Armadillidium nasatum]
MTNILSSPIISKLKWNEYYVFLSLIQLNFIFQFSQFSLHVDIGSTNSIPSQSSRIEKGEEALLISSISSLHSRSYDGELEEPVNNFDNSSVHYENLEGPETVSESITDKNDHTLEEDNLRLYEKSSNDVPVPLNQNEETFAATYNETNVSKPSELGLHSYEIVFEKDDDVVCEEITLNDKTNQIDKEKKDAVIQSSSFETESINFDAKDLINLEKRQNSVSDAIENTSSNEVEDDCNNASLVLTLIMVGLLNAIEEALRNLSDTQSSLVISEMFSIDLVVLFANNPSENVRSAALGLLRTMLFKSSKEYRNFHLKRNILHLMALQLHRYNPSSEALVAEAFALGLKLDLKIDDVTIEDVVFDHNHKINLFVPLFAVLPTCASDVSLCHITLKTFLHILGNALKLVVKALLTLIFNYSKPVKKNEELLLKFYTKAHFVDSLLMTLKNSLHLSPSICSDAKKSDDVTKGDYVINVNEPNIIIDDVIEILCYFIKKLVALEGNLYFTTCLEVLFSVNYYYRRELTRCGLDTVCSNAFLDMEGAVLTTALHELRGASVNIQCLQSQISVPHDTSSSTNSENDDIQNFPHSKNPERLRKFTNFFQRSSFSKDIGSLPSSNNNYQLEKRPSLSSGESPQNQESPTLEIKNPDFQRAFLKNIATSHNTVFQMCINYAIMATACFKQRLRPKQEKFCLNLLEVFLSSVKMYIDNGGSMLSKTYGLEFLAINFVNIGEVFWKYLTHLMSSEMSFKMKINVIDVIGTDPEFKKVIQYYVRFDMP